MTIRDLIYTLIDPEGSILQAPSTFRREPGGARLKRGGRDFRLVEDEPKESNVVDTVPRIVDAVLSAVCRGEMAGRCAVGVIA